MGDNWTVVCSRDVLSWRIEVDGLARQKVKNWRTNIFEGNGVASRVRAAALGSRVKIRGHIHDVGFERKVDGGWRPIISSEEYRKQREEEKYEWWSGSETTTTDASDGEYDHSDGSRSCVSGTETANARKRRGCCCSATARFVGHLCAAYPEGRSLDHALAMYAWDLTPTPKREALLLQLTERRDRANDGGGLARREARRGRPDFSWLHDVLTAFLLSSEDVMQNLESLLHQHKGEGGPVSRRLREASRVAKQSALRVAITTRRDARRLKGSHQSSARTSADAKAEQNEANMGDREDDPTSEGKVRRGDRKMKAHSPAAPADFAPLTYREELASFAKVHTRGYVNTHAVASFIENVLTCAIVGTMSTTPLSSYCEPELLEEMYGPLADAFFAYPFRNRTPAPVLSRRAILESACDA
jgi:hypothetical protein